MPLINSFMASSVYIIIFMTVNRYISIYKPTDFQRIHTLKNAWLCISLSFICGVLLHIPLCFQNKVDLFTNLVILVDLQVVKGPCVEGDLSRECLWGKEERSDIMGSLLFRAYLVTSEILLR